MTLDDIKTKLFHDLFNYRDLLKTTEIDYMKHYYQGKIDYIDQLLVLFPLTEEERRIYEL